MKIIELLASGIGKIWGFCTTIVLISVVSVIALFVMTVIIPDNVLLAFEIAKKLISGIM